jgi:hypothetical protein
MIFIRPELIGMITSNVFAATALAFALFTHRRENRRDGERHTDKRKEQSSRILVSRTGRPSEVDPAYTSLGWVIINHSGQPIYDVTASVDGGKTTAIWDSIAQGAIVRHNVSHVRRSEPHDTPIPTVEFVDCAGRHWKRHPTGMLQQHYARTWQPPEEPQISAIPDWVRGADNIGRADIGGGNIDKSRHLRVSPLGWLTVGIIATAVTSVVLLLI